MATKKKLVIEVDSKGVPKATRELDGLTKSSKKAGTGAKSLTNHMKGLISPMSGLTSRIGGLTSRVKGLISPMALATAGIGLATVSIGLAVGALGKMIRNTSIQDAAMAQLNSGLESTGHSAGFTADELSGLAAQMQKTTMFGDESVIQMQALLLTFTNIKETLPDTTRAVADMATRMGTDLKSAAIQLGKALNDPIANLSALSRSGVQFTTVQKDLIKSLWETGQQAEAQRVILAELDNQFGGSAKAARDTLGGSLKALSNNFNDLFELGTKSSGFFRGFVDGANSAVLAVGTLKSKVSDYFDYLKFMENRELSVGEMLFSTPESRKQYEMEQSGKGELKEGTLVGEGQLEADAQVEIDANAEKAAIIAEAQAEIDLAKQKAEAIHFGIMHKIRTEDAVRAKAIQNKAAKDAKGKQDADQKQWVTAIKGGNDTIRAEVMRAALEQAKIKGKQAIVNAFEFGTKTGGPWLGAAYAGAAGLAVGGLISAIKGAGSSGGSASVSVPEQPSTNSSTTTSDDGADVTVATTTTQMVNINLQGAGYSKENVRELIESINEEIGEGVVLKTNEDI